MQNLAPPPFSPQQIRRLLVVNPIKRLTATEALAHPFLQISPVVSDVVSYGVCLLPLIWSHSVPGNPLIPKSYFGMQTGNEAVLS